METLIPSLSRLPSFALANLFGTPMIGVYGNMMLLGFVYRGKVYFSDLWKKLS